MPGPSSSRPAAWGTVIAAVAVAVSMVAAGCGASLPTSSEAAATETATTVCGMLRDVNNELAASLNATSDAITDDDDPETAPRMLRDGFDDLIVIAEAHVTEVDELDLPFSSARDALVDDLRSGAEESVTELEDERDALAGLDPVEIDEQAGVLGGAFTSLEKAVSVLEPQIGAYGDDELIAAVAAEDTCRHVIQPA
jgi:hypothetical protein